MRQLFGLSREEQRDELTRQWDRANSDANDVESTLEYLRDRYDYCPPQDEDSLLAEIAAKEVLFDELRVKVAMLDAKLQALRN